MDETDDQNLLDHVLDYRFLEIELELGTVETQRQALESQLPSVKEMERDKIREEMIRDLGEELGLEQFQTGSWIDGFLEYELPRLFRYPTLVSLWAAYESATRHISRHLQKSLGKSLELDDIKGNVLSKTRKYFDQVLEFPLTGSPRELEYLQMLLVLRNAIAHANGRKEAIKPEVWRKISSWKIAGVDTDLEYLAFSSEFIESMVNVVTVSLSDLIERAKVAS